MKIRDLASKLRRSRGAVAGTVETKSRTSPLPPEHMRRMRGRSAASPDGDRADPAGKEHPSGRAQGKDRNKAAGSN